MPTPSENTQPIDRHNLSGLILQARVRRAHHDNCDLELLDPAGQVLALGRLHQSESLAAQDPRYLADLDAYAVGRTLEAVYVNHLRQQDGRPVWFVNERWGVNNPWSDLALDEDSVITGTLIRRVGTLDRPEPAGYIVQLDTTLPLYLAIREGLEALEARQPDIEVFLPVEEIPWADGGLDPSPSSPAIRRLALEIGDPIRAQVIDIHYPPKHPRISLIRLIHHLDATASRAFEHRETLARWRFRRLLGDAVPPLADVAATPAFTADEHPYAGRRLLLVDDDLAAAAAQAELLDLMGAKVRRVEVHPSRFDQAVDEVVHWVGQECFDLILVDNNLPGRDLGRRLVDQVRARQRDTDPGRFILLTANADTSAPRLEPDQLRTEGFGGLIHRPMAHEILQRLLAGEEVWETTQADQGAEQGQAVSQETSPVTPTDLIGAIAALPGVRFAMLFPGHRRLGARDLIGMGKLPFPPDQFDTVLAHTELRLLVNDRLTTLSIGPEDTGNEALRVSRDGVSHWRLLRSVQSRWVFGVGFEKGRTFQESIPLWEKALSAALEAQAWRESARHQSTFIQLGLAHVGLTHEIFNLQDELQSRLDSLNRYLSRVRPGEPVRDADRQKLTTALANLTEVKNHLLDFSKAQLRSEAWRHRQTFLPDAIDLVRRTVQVECDEAEVQLRIAAPPPLALPLPQAAIALPLTKLLLNAAKHRRPGDTDEVRRVELTFALDERDGASGLVAEVWDNGFGLDQRTRERLFEAGHSDAPDPNRRHGIGLWLSRQLVPRS